jgi:hypothetical protein
MPKSDQEVFEHFRSDYDRRLGIEVALLAYARFAQAKYDWVNHNQATEDEVARWISGLPNSYFSEIHKNAVNLFNDAAEEYMKPNMDVERAKAVEQSILNRVEKMAERVERATSSWRLFLPNVVASVVASFVFAAIVLFCVAVYHGNTSILDWFKEAPTHQ